LFYKLYSIIKSSKSELKLEKSEKLETLTSESSSFIVQSLKSNRSGSILLLLFFKFVVDEVWIVVTEFEFEDKFAFPDLRSDTARSHWE